MQVFVDMVVERLKTRGLPLIACPHTRGLQLENVINGIVDSHIVTCTQPSQQQAGPSQQQGIPLQDVDDDNADDDDDDANWEVEQASLLIEELANSLAKSHDAGSNKSNITSQSSNIPSQSSFKTSAPRKRPVSLDSENLERPKRSPKRVKSTPGPAIHKCDKCDKTFYLPKDRDRHRVVHFQVRPFKCEKCDYCAKTAHERTKHFQRVHLHRYPHHCPTCNKGYSSKNKLILHEKTHLNIDDKDRPFVCKHCGKGFFASRELDLHLAKHEKDKRFECDLCAFKSITRKTRLHHLNQTHQVHVTRKTNMCLVCNKELHEYHLLIAHMKENHKIAGVTCEECGAMFPNEKRLEHHMEKEHLPDPKCEECEETFKNNKLLTAHMKKDHWLGVECKKCGEPFKTDKQLDTHMLESHSDWPEKFKEELQPEKTASQQSIFNENEVTVFLDGEEQVFFTCKDCGGFFMSRDDLETHKSVHDGGTGVQCDKCDLMLGNQELLNAHVRKSHSSQNTEERSEVGSYKRWEVSVIVDDQEKIYFMCKVCGDLFTSKPGLESHMVDHGPHASKLKIKEPVLIPERTRYQRAVAKAKCSKRSTLQVSPSVDTGNQKETKESGASQPEMSLKGKRKLLGSGKSIAKELKKAKKAEKKQPGPSKRSRRTILVLDRNLKSSKSSLVVGKTVNQGQTGRVTKSMDKSSTVGKNQIDEVERSLSSTTKHAEIGGSKIRSEEKEDASVQLEKDHDYASNPSSTKEDKTKDGITDKTLNQSRPDDNGSSTKKETKGPPQVRIPIKSSSIQKQKDYFAMYSKSSDRVALMLEKGKVKMSLIIPGKSTKSSLVTLSLPIKTQSVSSTSGSTSSKPRTAATVTSNAKTAVANAEKSATLDVKNSSTESSDRSDTPSYVVTITESKSVTATPACNVPSDGETEKAEGGRSKESVQSAKSESGPVTPACNVPSDGETEKAEGGRSKESVQSAKSESGPVTPACNVPSDGETEKAEGSRSKEKKQSAKFKSGTVTPASKVPSDGETEKAEESQCKEKRH